MMSGEQDAPDGAAGFDEIQQVLIHFAQGLCALHPQFEAVADTTPDLLLGRGLHGGGVIRLPARVDAFPLRRHNLAVYRTATLHQLGYLENGTYDFTLRSALASMPPRLAARFDTRAAQGPELERFFAAWRRPALLRHVFALLEDMRIDAIICHRYPGARVDMARLSAHLLAARPPLHAAPPAAWLEGLVRLSLGAPLSEPGDPGDPIPPAAEQSAGFLSDIVQALLRRHASVSSVYDSACAAVEICLRLEQCMRSQPGAKTSLPTAERIAPDDSRIAGAFADRRNMDALFASEDDGKDADGAGAQIDASLFADAARWRQTRAGAGMPGQLSAPASADADAIAADQDGGDDKGAGEATTPRASSALTAATGKGEAVFRYDEWDCNRQAYLRSWCRLIEKPLRGADAGFVRDVRKRHGVLAARIMRQFSRIRPDALAHRHNMPDGEEIDIDGMIGAAVDRRAGHDSEARPYLRRDRSLRDACAAFLLDMSASTGFPIPAKAPPAIDAAAPDDDPYLYAGGGLARPADAPPPRRVIDVAKDSLALMCDALQALGDRHAVYGFSGDGREAVEFFIAKDFGDAWSQRAHAALAAMEPRRSTRAGTAIRHAAARLARQPERMKVLIVVSDGYPQDRDYGPDPDDNEYGIQDTARALQEARRRGIRDFCITIDPAGQDYLRRMCDESSYLVIDDVTALPDQLSKVYRTLTGAL